MEELTRVRNELGWSQQKLADESGVNKATINQIERGRRSPNIDTLQKLAAAMGREVGDFFPKVQASLWSDELPERRPDADGILRLGELMVAGWESEVHARLKANDEEWFERMTTMYAEFTNILSGLDISKVRDPEAGLARLTYMLDANARMADTIDPDYRHRFTTILEESGERMEALAGKGLST